MHRVVGCGWTGDGGGPHAEAHARTIAGEDAKQADVYVTLEPCAHYGKSPPCTQALIEAGCRRCHIALRDPDPRVRGAGIARLQQAGIAVVEGLLAREAAEVLAGYLMRHHLGRPFVTVKLAVSVDGRIAAADGTSKWLTGKPARRHAHLVRSYQDAILVGGNTVRLDDPRLTTRLPGYRGSDALAVVVSRRADLPLQCRLVANAGERPLLLATGLGVAQHTRKALERAGVSLVELPDTSKGLDLRVLCSLLAKRGINRLLAEGGGHLAASLLEQGLVDLLLCYRSPAVLGSRGKPSIGALSIPSLSAAIRLERKEVLHFGSDRVEHYTPKGQDLLRFSSAAPSSRSSEPRDTKVPKICVGHVHGNY